MKYDPKKLTYGDALRIATANLTVTAEDKDGQHVTGKLKHIGLNDALEGDNLAIRDLIAIALITTNNEYFVVRHDDGRILCPAIRFDGDLNVTWNKLVSIEENTDDGEELDFSEWKTKLVKDETPTATVDKPTTDTQAEEWEAKLPKANGFYKAATGSVWLHTGDVWTPILNHYGNVPPNALQQTTEAFAVSSGHSKRFPFERLCEKPLPTKPGWYKSADKTTLFHLDEFGVWRMVAYMAPTFSTLAGNGEWKTKYVPMQVDEIMPESKMRQYMPLIHYMLGLKQPKEEEYEENF